MIKHYQKIILLTLCFFLISNDAYCRDSNKEWNVGVISGPFSNDSAWQYYLEPQLRLINDRYVFNQAFFLTGIGYQFTPTLKLYVGPGYIFTLTTDGKTYDTYRVWQQLDWQAVKNSSFWLASRTRLQEDTRSNNTGVLVILRQRYWLRIPIKNTNHYFYSLFDEIFLNVNETSWSSHTLFEQNRLFAGIGKQITKNVFLDFGYLNQAQFGSHSAINNVIIFSFTVML
ncbi:MAG: DUF2490 domain-containing protein [Coxiellaceae bacterium]|nr:DUF2490 domain-containing protein [Coxiellaceae bacterium]